MVCPSARMIDGQAVTRPLTNPRTSHYPCSGFWGQVRRAERRIDRDSLLQRAKRHHIGLIAVLRERQINRPRKVTQRKMAILICRSGCGRLRALRLDSHAG